jgi:hypothetical protein
MLGGLAPEEAAAQPAAQTTDPDIGQNEVDRMFG